MANFSSISISSSSSSRVGFCDNNAHPSSLAFLCLGLSNCLIPRKSIYQWVGIEKRRGSKKFACESDKSGTEREMF